MIALKRIQIAREKCHYRTENGFLIRDKMDMTYNGHSIRTKKRSERSVIYNVKLVYFTLNIKKEVFMFLRDRSQKRISFQQTTLAANPMYTWKMEIYIIYIRAAVWQNKTNKKNNKN